MSTDPVQAAYRGVMERYGAQIEAEASPSVAVVSRSPRYIYAAGGLISLGVMVWGNSILIPVLIVFMSAALGYGYALPRRVTLKRPYNYQLSSTIVQDAIARFHDHYYEEWSYDPQGMDEYDFTTRFGYRYGDDYFSSDTVIGSYYGTRFETCEVHSTYEETEEYEETETYTDAEGETQTRTTTHTREYTVTIFRGEAITLYPRIRFRTYLLLIPYSGYGQNHHMMDHDRFNRYYSIICDDPIYVRYLLTQPMMDRLVELREFLGVSPKIHFIDDEIRITIPCSEKYPSADFTDVRGSLEKYFYEAATVADVLSILAIDKHHIAQNEPS